MLNEVLKKDHVEQLKEAMDNWAEPTYWEVAPPPRRAPQYMRVAVNATEGRISELPSYEHPMYDRYMVEVEIDPSQAYDLAKIIVNAVEEGLGDMPQDRFSLVVQLNPQPNGAYASSMAQCTPGRNPVTGADGFYSHRLGLSGGLDE